MLERIAVGFRAIVWALAVVYPVALYWAVTRHGVVGGAAVGLLSALLWAARAALQPKASAPGGRALGSVWLLPLSVVCLSGLTLLTEDRRLLLGLPVLINAVLLVGFGSSLRSGQSYIERIARLREPDLSHDKVRHCRQFTWVWVGFFLLNGGVTAALALRGQLEAWTIYTAALSYLFIALLLAAEWIVRRRRFGRAAAGELGDSGEMAKVRELEP